MNIVLLFFKQLPNIFFFKILIIKQIVKLLLTVTFVYIYNSFFFSSYLVLHIYCTAYTSVSCHM